MKKLAVVISGLVFVWAQSAWAQNDRVTYKKKTIIDLSGATIEGELTKPEGSYIVNRKLSRFSTLISPRANFRSELLTTHNEL